MTADPTHLIPPADAPLIHDVDSTEDAPTYTRESLGDALGRANHVAWEARQERDAARARVAECERDRDALRAQFDEHRSFCDELTESLVDMTIDASTTALERDAAIQRAERAESDRLAEVEGLTAERDYYRTALHQVEEEVAGAIVAWLRDVAGSIIDVDAHVNLHLYADDIEAGAWRDAEARRG